MRFNYKADNGQEYLGFIAEDVPEAVATADRQGLSSMDIVASARQGRPDPTGTTSGAAKEDRGAGEEAE